MFRNFIVFTFDLLLLFQFPLLTVFSFLFSSSISNPLIFFTSKHSFITIILLCLFCHHTFILHHPYVLPLLSVIHPTHHYIPHSIPLLSPSFVSPFLSSHHTHTIVVTPPFSPAIRLHFHYHHTLPHHITNNTCFFITSYTILASFASTTRSTFSHHHYHHPPLQNKRAHLAKRLNSSAWERHHRLGHKSHPPVHTRAFLLHVMARKIELNGLFKRRGEAKRCREQWRMWE